MPTIYQAMWYFLIYAFLGWCVEVVFQAASHGRFINRGFLNGPVCPIYGFGVLTVVTLLEPISDSLPLLFIGSVLLTSAIEFVTGYLLERVFHDKWWDYSAEQFNIKGYVCLRFSLAWGLACVLVVDVVHPLIVRLVDWLPDAIGVIALAALFAALITDVCLTVAATSKLRKRLKLMDELSARLRVVSDGIGAPMAERAIDLKGRLEERKPEAEALRERLKALAEESRAGERRLLKAFPRLQLGRYSESVENIRRVWYGKASAVVRKADRSLQQLESALELPGTVQKQYSSRENLEIRIAIHAKYGTAKQTFYDWLFERYSFDRPVRVLELGCGSAAQWEGRTDRLPGGSLLVLTDRSDSMVSAAWERCGSNEGVIAARADIMSIPYPDASFDRVIANHMLYHLSDIPGALSEVRRVLRPDGIFYAATTGENGMSAFMREQLRRFDPKIDAFAGQQSFTLQNGKKILGEFFAEVEMLEYEDSLRVTDGEDLAAWVRSVADIGGVEESRLDGLEDYFSAIIEERGAIEIPKETGLFIAKNSIESRKAE